MNNKKIGILIFGVAILISFLLILNQKKEEKMENSESLSAMVLAIDNETITLEDANHIIYTFNKKDMTASVGDYLLIEYLGVLDKNKSIQDCTVTNYTKTTLATNENGIPTEWMDEGIFKNYYPQAYQKLLTLSLDEKIGQLFLVRHPSTNALEDLKKYHFGGFVFFERDFQNKTENEVKNMIQTLQKESKIPLLTAVDEEGGRIVRISRNPNLVDTPFLSSKDLYQLGGFNKIKEDTIQKSNILYNLGLNLNLAPVVDVTLDANAYMYERAFGQNTDLTSTYAKTVIEASKGTNVSYTLKHFPGYGNNADTHTNSVTDQRTYSEILTNDLPPFEAGIQSGAEAVLVAHNIVTSIDHHPASLSPSVHNILRNHLDFTGVIMTDDIDMGATFSIQNVAVQALLAGNDLIITTNYQNSIASIKTALENDTISEDLVDRIALRVLAWKYYKGIMYDEK